MLTCIFLKCTFTIVLCRDTCEPICFKLVKMLNTTKLYRSSLIPEEISVTCLTKFVIDLDLIWYAVETCWSDESRVRFISPDQYSTLPK